MSNPIRKKYLGVGVLAGALLVGLPTLPVADALADEEMAATVDEHQSKARVFHDKAAKYRAEAAENRQIAKRYREAKNSKGQKIKSPEYRKMAADYEDMARHDDALAKDAERIALFHERQVRLIQEGKSAE